jgi:hypothetical protein
MKNFKINLLVSIIFVFSVASCAAVEDKKNITDQSTIVAPLNCVATQLPKEIQYVTKMPIGKRSEFISSSFQEQLSLLDYFFDERTKTILINSSKTVFLKKENAFSPTNKDLLKYMDKIAFYASDAYGVKDCGPSLIVGEEIRTYIIDSIRSDLSFNEILDTIHESASLCLGKGDKRSETTRVLAAYGLYKGSHASIVCKKITQKR